jgi:hypothetical protein
VKVTEPVGVPLAALTLAVKVTHESRVIDVEDEVSVVVVAANAAGNAAAPTAVGNMRLTTARMPELTRTRRYQRTFPPPGLRSHASVLTRAAQHEPLKSTRPRSADLVPRSSAHPP